jgi:hypothetical protein
VTRDREEAINSYITDMLSLEEHIEKAVRVSWRISKIIRRSFETYGRFTERWSTISLT